MAAIGVDSDSKASIGPATGGHPGNSLIGNRSPDGPPAPGPGSVPAARRVHSLEIDRGHGRMAAPTGESTE